MHRNKTISVDCRCIIHVVSIYILSMYIIIELSILFKYIELSIYFKYIVYYLRTKYIYIKHVYYLVYFKCVYIDQNMSNMHVDFLYACIYQWVSKYV